jgi:hypothetical protein
MPEITSRRIPTHQATAPVRFQQLDDLLGDRVAGRDGAITQSGSARRLAGAAAETEPYAPQITQGVDPADSISSETLGSRQSRKRSREGVLGLEWLPARRGNDSVQLAPRVVSNTRSSQRSKRRFTCHGLRRRGSTFLPSPDPRPIQLLGTP